MTCRICEGSDIHAFRALGRSYGRCATCHCIQRTMTAQDYAAMEVTYDSGDSIATNDRATVEAWLGIDRALAVLRKYRPDGAIDLLDIGCGMGAYLRAGQLLGMNVVGYEPSLGHSRIARTVFGFDVRPTYFEGTEEQFDLIVLSHVIEHIYDPRAFLALVVKSLRPGGRLMIVTPNANAYSARLTGTRWPMLVPEDHVSMLSPEALARIVPDGCTATTMTSESGFEFLATVAAAVRSRRPRKCGEVSSVLAGVSLRTRLLKFGLAVGSLPFHWAAALSDRRGALVGLIDRPA